MLEAQLAVQIQSSMATIYIDVSLDTKTFEIFSIGSIIPCGK